MLVVTLTAPWRELQRKDDYQGAYPARIEYRDETGTTVELELTVERRGIKRQEACKFPPIRLRFDKQSVKGTVFRGEKSLKMVTHCEKSKRFDQYYILEMLAYRMYNMLTDYSFRVRLVNMTYVYTDRNETTNSYAVFIEHKDRLGKRIDGEPVEVVTTGRHDPCVGIRATPIAEAMLAIVLMDHMLRHRAQNMDVDSPTPVVPAAADE